MINWRVIGWGLILELIVALIVFVVPIGTQLFLIVNDVVNNVLESANYGTYFVFGKLALGPGSISASGETSIGFILAFQGLAVIVFFAALVGILYYLGIMGKVMKAFSLIFSKLMGISGAESLSSASSIFVGVEAGLVIKPYISKMTRSELNTILTVGMSTIASSMLAVYIMILKGSFPNIAGHLVSASIMNVPAAIIMSKILLFAGSYVNNLFSINIDWTLKGLLGYIFYPLTLLIGIPVSDAWEASKIIGERLILTEVTAFQDLAIQLNSISPMAPRSAVMVTYALTGFAHVASIAIFVGGYIAIAPSKIKELSSLSFRALIGATLACLLTAAIAGLFFTNNSILLGQ
ncbi:MAG: hypothetical protein M0P71_05575 [Melioribacteraceae bacterium]|nr:hypothetical protein [Melioribacteraceae bacterium]